MACWLTPAQLEQQTDRVLCTVEGMAQKNLPATSGCSFLDASRMAIRVQLAKFPHQLIRANASHADRLLQLELKLSNGAQGQGAAAADAVPLRATLPQAFRLASAPLTDGHFTLSVDGDSIFRNTAEPQEVTKGERVFPEGEGVVVRLRDRSQNFYYHQPGSGSGSGSGAAPPPGGVCRGGPGVWQRPQRPHQVPPLQQGDVAVRHQGEDL
ncbi:MAG: hypothetical protein WDW38_009253 [Sanguina aurantia]